MPAASEHQIFNRNDDLERPPHPEATLQGRGIQQSDKRKTARVYLLFDSAPLGRNYSKSGPHTDSLFLLVRLELLSVAWVVLRRNLEFELFLFGTLIVYFSFRAVWLWVTRSFSS